MRIVIKMKATSIISVFTCFFVVLAASFLMSSIAYAQIDNTKVEINNAGVIRVAPGELLPVSVKLSNFGGGKRVDVAIEYSIFTKTGSKIYSTSDTVAIETTANFLKTIQIPFDTVAGIYTVKTSVTYVDQVTPAISQFPFRVEKKIMGVFQNDFFLYGGVILVLNVLAILSSKIFIKNSRKTRFTPFDYSNVPHNERIFYEILSDTIMTMRWRVGEEAILVATHIPGLEIDKKTGRVLALTKHPAKIIATLVHEYENRLNKKVSFSFRRDNISM